jgi:hypothetical protein
MKHSIILTMFFFATLAISLAAVAKEMKNAADCFCSSQMVAGTWGYTETGTLILPAPTGAIPYSSMGIYTIDLAGNVLGTRIASAGGTMMKATIKGTATVNPDCTGTYTVRFYDPVSGNPQVTVDTVKAIVYVDNAREAHMILASGSYPSILTTVAKRVFPGSIWFPEY